MIGRLRQLGEMAQATATGAKRTTELTRATSAYLEDNPAVAEAMAAVRTPEQAEAVATASRRQLLGVAGLAGREFDVDNVGALLGEHVRMRGTASILAANAGAISLQIKVGRISVVAHVRQVDARHAVLELDGPGGIGGEFIGRFKPGTARAASMHPEAAEHPLAITLDGADPATANLTMSMEFGGRHATLELIAR